MTNIHTDLQNAFTALHSAFLNHPTPTLSMRQKNLARLKQQLLKYRRDLCHAVTLDFGLRCTAETQLAEIIPVLETLSYVRNKLRTWMKPQKRQVLWLLQPGSAEICYQPLGVVGIMSPWNYPIQLTLIPLIYALAAGNRVFIKTSELTPHTAACLQKMLNELFPQDTVSLISGDTQTAAAFSQLPFQHLFFTGSTQTGKKIMAAAAENLTPVTLELGGKSPVIIGTDANVSETCQSIIFGKGFNAGQTCIAPDILLCPTAFYEKICTELAEAAKKLYPRWIENPDYTQIINEHHLSRLDHLLEDAQQKGAHSIPLNHGKENFADCQKRPITLVSNIREDMDIAQEEIFGPWLIMVCYDTLDEAIEYINAHHNPLALYYFGHQHADIEKIIQKTRSGGVCINDMLSHIAVTDLPFGGLGHSGMGQYHGIEGFRTFSHAKPIFRRKKINPTRWLYPPWQNRFLSLLFKRYF